MDRREFAVVHFLNEGSVEVIPTKWLDCPDLSETEAFWPPEKGWPLKGSRYVQLKKCVQALNNPDTKRPVFKVKVLHLFRTYEDAVRGSKKAEYDSNLDTEKELISRKRCIPQRFKSSDLESEDNSSLDKNNSPVRTLQTKRKRVKKIQSASDSDDVLEPPKISDHLKESLIMSKCATSKIKKGKKESPKIIADLKKSSISSKHSTLKINKGKENPYSTANNVKKTDICNAKSRALTKAKSLESTTQNLSSEFNNDKTPNKIISKKINMTSANEIDSNKTRPTFKKVSERKRCGSVLDETDVTFTKTFDSSETSPISTSPFKVTPSNSFSDNDNPFNPLDFELQDNVENSPIDEIPNAAEKSASGTSKDSNFYGNNSSDNLQKLSSQKKAAKDKEEAKLTSTILLQVNKQLDAVLLNQAIIIRAIDPNLSEIVRPEQMPTMPMRVITDFNKMEKFLQEPTDFCALRDRLWMLSTGSENEKKATGKMLSHMMFNSLATKFSWKGSGGSKVEFQTTKSCEVVFSAIGLRFKGSNLDDAESKMKDWFRTASYKKQENQNT